MFFYTPFNSLELFRVRILLTLYTHIHIYTYIHVYIFIHSFVYVSFRIFALLLRVHGRGGFAEQPSI